jgi:PDDEXK-like domain of unknown function (DUF3799)
MANRTEPLPDGIYLGLDEATYHADPALGSSNLRNLIKGANIYWYDSPLNPNRQPDKITDAKIFGKGMHKLLLEGSAPFQAIYVRRPDDDEDASSADKTALTKAAKKNLQDHQFLLKGAEYDFIRAVKGIIDNDPELTGCLDNALTEVSTFWTRKDGTRLKSRTDVLKLRGYGDIKSIANERNHEMGQACRYAITQYRYDMQIEHYNEGRAQLARLLDKGAIYFATTPASKLPAPIAEGPKRAIAFLEKIAAQDSFAAQLVFVPKLGNDNASTKAPDAWSCVISPKNPGLKVARDDIETALMIYHDAMKKYGPDKPWMPGRAVSELAWEEMPWALSRRAA